MLRMLLLLLAQAALAAGTADSPVPVGEEPRHKVVFENAYVRVIDATLPAGYVSLFHTHARDNVPVAVMAGRIRTDMPGQSSREIDVAAGEFWFSPGGYVHRVTNVGPTTVRFIDVEILESPPREGAGAAPALDGHKLELENDRVRVYRLRLPPGGSLPAHRHARAVLRVTVPSQGSAAAASFSWHPSGSVPELANHDAGPLEAIEIQWKGGTGVRSAFMKDYGVRSCICSLLAIEFGEFLDPPVRSGVPGQRQNGDSSRDRPDLPGPQDSHESRHLASPSLATTRPRAVQFSRRCGTWPLSGTTAYL